MKSELLRTATALLLAVTGMGLGLGQSKAMAADLIGRVNVVGDLNYNVYSQDFSKNSVNYHGTGSLGYGGGVLLDFGLADAIGLESGAIYFVRKINVDTGAGTSSNLVFPSGDMDVVHIPVDAVFGLNDLVSVLGGVFDEIPVNSTSGSNNFGIGGGIRFGIPIGAGTRFLVEARYNHGLTDQGSFHTNDIHALIGLSFGGT